MLNQRIDIEIKLVFSIQLRERTEQLMESNRSFPVSKTSPVPEILKQLYLLKPISIGSAKESSFVEFKTLVLEILLSLVSLSSIILCVRINNIQNPIFPYTLLSFLTAINLFLLIITKLSQTKLLKTRGQINSSQHQLHIESAIQSILYVIHPNSYCISITLSFRLFNSYYQYPLNDILSFFVFFRSVHIIRLFFKCLIFYGTRAERLGKLIGLKPKGSSILYSMKCFYKTYKLTSILLSLSVLIVIFGYLQTFAQSYQSFSMGFQMIYYSVVSFTTVGFGDIVPETTLGRLIAAILFTLVQILISLSALHSLKLFELTENQAKSYELSKRFKTKNEEQQLKRENIRQFLRLYSKREHLQFKARKLPNISYRKVQAFQNVQMIESIRIFSEKNMLLNLLIKMVGESLDRYRSYGSVREIKKKGGERVVDNRQVEAIISLIFNQ